jgi:hypothetical protein
MWPAIALSPKELNMNGTPAYQLDSALEYIAAYDRSPATDSNRRFLLRVRNDLVRLAEREAVRHHRITETWELSSYLCHEIDCRLGPDYTG